MMLYLGLNTTKAQIFWPTVNFKISKLTCILSTRQSAVRPACARYRAPKISHGKGNDGGFTKMLFRS